MWTQRPGRALGSGGWSDAAQVPVIRLSGGVRWWSRAGGRLGWVSSRSQHWWEARDMRQWMRTLVLPAHGGGRHAHAAEERPSSWHHAHRQHFLRNTVLLALLGTPVLKPHLQPASDSTDAKIRQESQGLAAVATFQLLLYCIRSGESNSVPGGTVPCRI